MSALINNLFMIGTFCVKIFFYIVFQQSCSFPHLVYFSTWDGFLFMLGRGEACCFFQLKNNFIENFIFSSKIYNVIPAIVSIRLYQYMLLILNFILFTCHCAGIVRSLFPVPCNKSYRASLSHLFCSSRASSYNWLFAFPSFFYSYILSD